MNSEAMQILEFDKIREMLKLFTVSALGKDRISRLEPSIDVSVIKVWLNETTEACAILNRSSSVPIHSLCNLEGIMTKISKETTLLPEELEAILGLLLEVCKLKRFMADKQSVAPTISSYALSAYECEYLSEEIERCIQNGRVIDRASSELNKARKKIIIIEDKIKAKLEGLIKSSNTSCFLQDSIVSIRDGRYVIPVKKEHKRNIEGNILDTSASGSTVFIEPAEIRKLQDELNHCKIEEEKEVYRILSYLTNLVESYKKELSTNIEVMANYDFIFAKAKFSRSLDANPVSINTSSRICIISAKHPLIGKNAVPLDISIGEEYRTLVITGPNTGGKTVALKTVGLLTLMVQCGLHVPAAAESEFAVFTEILVDIGDGQSIEQSLSTFSSHIRNIISIVEYAGENTLVIMDELGAGTDPVEGMGLAVAILEEIHSKGAITIATTHYSEIKEYAAKWDGFENGCMEFDINTLKPLYSLKVGKAGKSNAFLISLRLGMRKDLIERAHEISYKESITYEAPVKNAEEKSIGDVECHTEQLPKSHKLPQNKRLKDNVNAPPAEVKFNIGDSVYISSMDRTGIVCEQEDGRGNLGVMVMQKKLIINKKRLSLHIASKDLYPDDYDFDIIFESKENRKKKKIMSKKHVEGMVIEVKKGFE